MDLDGNGRRDVLSGSWPGEIFCFAEQEDGSFERRELTHANGEKINVGSASAVFATDWDRDGDLDLIVGEIGGKVFLIPDESGDDEPAAFGDAVQLQADGKPLAVSGRDAGPAVADWDGDGRADLLVGSGSGDVTLFRCTNDEGLPVLAAGRTLIPAAANSRGSSAGGTAGATGGAARPTPGRRTKICVTDWNGDGRLDLLVGDFATEMKPMPELTDEQKQEKTELEAKQQELSAKLQPIYQRLMEKAREGLDADPADMTLEQRRAYSQAFREAMAKDEAYMELRKEMTAVAQKLRAYRPGYEYRGWVWLFQRSAPAPDSAPPSEPEATGPSQDEAPGQQ